MPKPPADDPVAPRDRADWRRWLGRHHAQPHGVWLLIRKRDRQALGVTYEEAVREALCFGWIDSTAGSVDEDHYRLWMAPRKPRSAWSAINKRRVDELQAEGLLAPPGLTAIATAKRNGAWDTLSRSDALEVPKDLAAALRRNPPARTRWNAFPPSARKQMLAWIDAAKRPETRAKRIEQTATLAAENIRANEWRPKQT
jgi:uncharacterized protein YdeI (YjbR/CyaY-like superfamily)